jgi:hypothetical protein
MPLVPNNLADIIRNGNLQTLLVHLTDDEPLPFPITLAKLDPATFPGYRPSLTQVSVNGSLFLGNSQLSGRATFTNLGPAFAPPPSAIYITTAEGAPTLIGLSPLNAVSVPVIPSGTFYLNFQLYGGVLVSG